MSYWAAISNLGDIAITAPLAAGIAVFFAIGRAWRPALWWSIFFVFGLMLVLVSKVAFIGWGIGNQALDFTGFSGHAMRAMAIFPVLGYLLAKKIPASGGIRFMALLIFLGMAVIVGVSRFILHVHSWSEVFSGWIIGATLSFYFIFLVRHWTSFSVFPVLIMVMITPLLITPYIEPTPTQAWVTDLSLYLSGHEQPFIRDDWNFSTSYGAAERPASTSTPHSGSAHAPLSMENPLPVQR